MAIRIPGFLRCGGSCITPPAGSNGQVQFNDNGSFGADSNLFWDNTAKELQTGTIRGSDQSGGNLILKSTSNATKGKIFFGANSVYDEVNNRLGICITTPLYDAHIDGSVGLRNIIFRLDAQGQVKHYVDTQSINFLGGTTNKKGASFSMFGRDSTSPGNQFFNFGGYDGVGSSNFRHVNTAGSFITVMTINNDGSVKFPFVYDDTVGGTNRDLYIDNTGKIGYVSSALKYKENLRDISVEKIADIFKISIKKFDYKDASKGVDQLGILAEDMEQYFPELCSYKYEYIDEIQQDEEGNDILVKIPVLDEQGNHINEIETVQYSKVGLLALLAVKNLDERLKAIGA